MLKLNITNRIFKHSQSYGREAIHNLCLFSYRPSLLNAPAYSFTQTMLHLAIHSQKSQGSGCHPNLQDKLDCSKENSITLATTWNHGGIPQNSLNLFVILRLKPKHFYSYKLMHNRPKPILKPRISAIHLHKKSLIIKYGKYVKRFGFQNQHTKECKCRLGNPKKK